MTEGQVKTAGRHRWSEYPDYSENQKSGTSWLSVLPTHWKPIRLKYAIRLQYGDPLKAEDREQGEIPVFGSNGIVGLHTKANVRGPAIIIGRKGSYGKVNYCDSDAFAIDTTYFVNSEYTECDLNWLCYALPLLGLDEDSQDAAVPGLSRERAYAKWLPSLPLREQQAIAAFLDRETFRIDAVINCKKRLIELLEEKRKAVIHHVITQGLDSDVETRDSGVQWIGEIPQHWEVWRLKHACRLETGHTPRKTEEGYWVADECTIPWISLNDTKTLYANDFISETVSSISAHGMNNSSAHLIEAGAVVVNRDGARVGLAAIMDKPMCVSQHIIAWVCGPKVFNQYLLHVLYAMESEIYRITAGSTIPTIGMPEVKGMTMPLPPMEEQIKIVDTLLEERARIAKLTQRLTDSIDALTEYRTALISAAVTGQIDVRDEVTLHD